MQKIIDGMKFGLGFGLAFLAIVYFGLGFVLKGSVSTPGNHSSLALEIPEDSYVPTESVPRPSHDDREEVRFGDLGLEDQIKYATVIAVTEHRKSEDGETKSVIVEILKKADGVTFYYDVGDEFRRFYPEERVLYGDGEVMFFTGSPAMMRVSMSYDGERIGSLGDMPMRLLREKCETPEK
jgi:hypothetical protein